MKKWFALFLSVLMLATLVMPASAAVTGTYTDEIVDGFAAEVVAFSAVGEDAENSHKIVFENNLDLERTLLLKTAAPRSSAHTEWIIYEMESMIAGFEFDVMCLAGLGDPLTDISVFVGTSKDGPWTEISTQATRYEMVKYPGTDEEIYISEDTAYWWQSTLMNKAKINNKGKFLKIQFNPCTDKDDVPWNVAIDTIRVTLGNNVAAPTIPAEKKFKTWTQINAEKEATRTTAGNGGTANTTAANNGGNTNNTTANNGGTANTTVNNNVGGTNNTTANNGGTSDNTTLGGDNVTTNAEGTVDGTTTAADGTVDNNTTAADGTAPTDNVDNNNDDGNKDTDTGSNAENKPGAWIWIVVGVAVLAAGAAVVLVVLKKKKA